MKIGRNIQKITKQKRALKSMKLNLVCMALRSLYHVEFILYVHHLPDHLLSVLLDIPLINSDRGKQKVPLLEIALEQNRTTFLNNEVYSTAAL